MDNLVRTPDKIIARAILCIMFMAAEPTLLVAQMSGTITGRAYDESTKEPLLGANVVLKGTTMGAITDAHGTFTIANVLAGTYTLAVSIVGYSTKEVQDVVVGGDQIALEIGLEQTAVQASEVLVYGVSLRKERLTEAPAAVSVIEARDFKLSGGHGQLPKLLETEPGVDIAQSGLNDFNVNTRGFNSSLNRRLQVLLDGRDLAIAFLGAQEWNGLSVPIEDLGRMELVRGPSSALYGANAFNGVINIQTPRAKDIPGTKVTLAGGELNSFRSDIRHAGESGPWGYKFNAGRFQGTTTSVTRKNLQFEYDGFTILNNEETDLLTNRVSSTYGSGRIDYDFEDGATTTAEAGLTQVEGEVFITGIGRVQVPKALKPWGRVNYSNESWYVQLWSAGRDSKDPQVSLSGGIPLIERSTIGQGEVQYRTLLLADQLFFVGGLSYRYQQVNTEETLMKAPRFDNSTGLYAQLEYTLSPKLKFVGAARWDRTTLHDAQISPKLAVVWTPIMNHSFRATVNRAFQSPNLSELFLFVLRTATNPYTGLKSYFAYHGNSNLKVEKITGYEVGYKGIFASDLYATVDGYFNVLNDFITDLAPGVHPDYPQPVILPGDSVLRAIWSYSNAGNVNEFGFEVGINYYLFNTLSISGNYAYFDFTVIEKGDKDILLPNAPKHKMNAGLTYSSPAGLEVTTRIKYVPSYDWAAGIYQGRILAYALVDVSGRYHVTENLDLGFNVANLLNRSHYEIFGGSVLGRRSIATLTATF